MRTVKVDFAVEEGVVHELHGDLFLAVVLCLELGIVDGEVLFDVLAWQLYAFILTSTKHTHECPVGYRHGYTENDDKKEVGLEAATVDERNEPFDKVRDTKYDPGEHDV